MKLPLFGVVLVGGFTVLFGERPIALAEPLQKLPAPAKKEPSQADPLGVKVQEAQVKGIKYLKEQQRDQGGGTWNWENDTFLLLQPGGASALALLALLESGVKPNVEVVARGLNYLRTVEPKRTYVVSLQTQVFCKANQKVDADRIKRNVKWLEDSALRTGETFEGWSYTESRDSRADHSNTRFAVAALDAAHQAGFKLKNEGLWEDVRALFVRTQKKDGGWGYLPELAKRGGEAPNSTHTMTVGGVLCLTLAKNVVGKESKAAEAARRNGEKWITGQFGIERSPSTFYNLDVIAALGRATQLKVFGDKDKKYEWYPLGADWLLKIQKPGGEWKANTTLDNFEIISTSFALRFLASRPE